VIVVSRDIVGEWFRAQASLGEDTDIHFGHVDAPGGPPVWTPVSHQRFDGVGGFVKLLRETGHTVDAMPELKDERTPRLFRVVHAWARYLFRRRPTYRWAPLPASTVEGAPPAMATHVFDEDATRAVAASAKSLGITVNTLLLDRLTRVIRRTILGRPRSVSWMIPINMRGGVKLADEMTNHSSFLEISVVEGEAATALQQRVRQAVADHQHWAFWYSFQAGRYFGMVGRRLFMKASIFGRSHWVGSFSNLGVWNPVAEGAHPYAWFFCPPPVPSQPFGVGCVTYQGRLSLTLQAHSSIAADASVAARWLREIVEEIQRGDR